MRLSQRGLRVAAIAKSLSKLTGGLEALGTSVVVVDALLGTGRGLCVQL